MATIPKEKTDPTIDGWINLRDACQNFRAELSTLSSKLDPETNKGELQKLAECSDHLKRAENAVNAAADDLIDAAAGICLTA